MLTERKQGDGGLPERWEGFQDIDLIAERMRRMLGRRPSRMLGVWSPPIDLEETDDAYLLEAELPGIEGPPSRVWEPAGNQGTALTSLVSPGPTGFLFGSRVRA